MELVLMALVDLSCRPLVKQTPACSAKKGGLPENSLRQQVPNIRSGMSLGPVPISHSWRKNHFHKASFASYHHPIISYYPTTILLLLYPLTTLLNSLTHSKMVEERIALTFLKNNIFFLAVQ